MRVVDTSNCIDFICFAKEKSCSLLKDYAISYFVARSGDILNGLDSALRIKESPGLVLEILCAIMKIKLDDTTSPSKSRKWNGLLSRRNRGRVVPMQP